VEKEQIKMVDERGRDEKSNIQMVQEGQKMKCEIVSIPEDLGHWCNWRTCHSRRGILDALRKCRRKNLGCILLLIPTTPPRDPLVDFRVFSLNTVKMDLALS
jgi:hypothetical protein